MSDNTKPGATPDDDANPNPDDANQDDPDADIAAIPDLNEGGRKAIKAEREARKAADDARTTTDTALKKLEKDHKALVKELAALKNTGKPELDIVTGERDALREEIDTLKGKQRETNGREAVRTAALRMGVDPKNADLVYRSVRGDLDYGDGDDPKNVTALLNELKTDYAYLFKLVAGKVDAGTGKDTKPKDDPNAALRRALGRTG